MEGSVMNGNSSFSNSNSFNVGAVDDPKTKLLYWFGRMAMGIPVTNVSGI
jgi:hypothetical protein